ncbi:hypothetical protein LIT25_18650 [Bacillus sp. F19]|nr:hypothetical protein LIT25_18650 [Bacillus sp. F19]
MIILQEIGAITDKDDTPIGRIVSVHVLINNTKYLVEIKKDSSGKWILNCISHFQEQSLKCPCSSNDYICDLFDDKEEEYIFSQVYDMNKVRLQGY